jgi:hypothetical protein
MNSHRQVKEKQIDDSLDGLIRWALHDSVAGAEPSSQVWERIEASVVEELEQAAKLPQPRSQTYRPRSWLAGLLGAGARNLVPGYTRSAGQRQLHAFEFRASQSGVSLVECTLPVLRLVA